MEPWEIKEHLEIEPLEKYSIYGELVTYSKSFEKISTRTRQLVFQDMECEIAKHYLALNERSKRIVGAIVNNLTKGKEHQGFNLKLFLYWMANNASEHTVEQKAIAKHFVATDGERWQDENEVRYPSKEINRRINALKNGESFQYSKEKKEFKSPYIQLLCDNFLISVELLTSGFGEVECVKQEILDEYEKNPELYKIGRKTKILNYYRKYYQDSAEDVLAVSVREKLKQIAILTKRTWTEVADIQYGIINYTYAYRLLEESSDQSKKELVDDLIEELYSQQKKYEDDLRTQQEKHDTELQQLYASILEAGISKGDFGAIAKLDDAVKRQ